MDEKQFGMQQALGAATQIVQLLEHVQTDAYGKREILEFASRLIEFDAPRRPRSLADPAVAGASR